MGLSYDRIKSSFVQQLESAGLVSLDQGRHLQLSQAVDSLAEGLRVFLTEEQPEVVAAAPKVDPKANADDVAAWLVSAKLPDGWKFRQIPTTAHGAGQSVFAHYDIKQGVASLVSGLAHVHLISPDGKLVDVLFSPSDGERKFLDAISFEIEMFRKEAVVMGDGDQSDLGQGTGPILLPVEPLNAAAKKNEAWTPAPPKKHV